MLHSFFGDGKFCVHILNCCPYNSLIFAYFLMCIAPKEEIGRCYFRLRGVIMGLDALRLSLDDYHVRL